MEDALCCIVYCCLVCLLIQAVVTGAHEASVYVTVIYDFYVSAVVVVVVALWCVCL